MDSTAAEFETDSDGVCNFCEEYDKHTRPIVEEAQNGNRESKLEEIFQDIKQTGGKYDGAIAMSGGMDSCYAAYVTVQKGLNPLAIHIDTGWNSEMSEQNVKNTVDSLDLDLERISIDREEMYDLQYSFYKASVMDCELPHDHILWGAVRRFAQKKDISNIIIGNNYVSESILPKSWTYVTPDAKHIKSIHKKFGKKKIDNLPIESPWRQYLYYPIFDSMKKILPLNYVPLDRQEAKSTLEDELGWQSYSGKHGESVITRFFQRYYLPEKFNIDKRKAHLSSLINSEQISRQEAVDELQQSPYVDSQQLERDKKEVAEKFGLTESEFEEILNKPPHEHESYPNDKYLIKGLMFLRSNMGI